MKIRFSHTQPHESRLVEELPIPPRVGEYVSFDGGETNYKVERVIWRLDDPKQPETNRDFLDDIGAYVLLEPR